MPLERLLPAGDSRAPNSTSVLLALVLFCLGASASASIGPIERVRADTPINGDDFKQVEAVCPPGKIAFSGGARVIGSNLTDLRVIVHQSLPQGNPPDRWLALAQEPEASAEPWGLSAYALCAAIPGYEVVSASSPLDSVDAKSLSLSCPAGKRPIGGGGGILFFSPSLRLRAMFPTETGWYVLASESTPTSSSWQLLLRLSCAEDSGVLDISVSSYTRGETGLLQINCPQGMSVVAGGVGASDADDPALFSSAPALERSWSAGVRRLGAAAIWRHDGYLLCVTDTIFRDDFETGGTTRWSATS